MARLANGRVRNQAFDHALELPILFYTSHVLSSLFVPAIVNAVCASGVGTSSRHSPASPPHSLHVSEDGVPDLSKSRIFEMVSLCGRGCRSGVVAARLQGSNQSNEIAGEAITALLSMNAENGTVDCVVAGSTKSNRIQQLVLTR